MSTHHNESFSDGGTVDYVFRPIPFPLVSATISSLSDSPPAEQLESRIQTSVLVMAFKTPKFAAGGWLSSHMAMIGVLDS